MRHPRIIIAGIGLAAVAAVGGVTAASAGGSAASSAPSASPTAAAAAVRTAPATVAGRTETILVNAHGLPPVLLPARHGGEVVCHRKPGQPVAAGDLGRAHRHRGKRQARRTQRRQRPPGTYNGHPLYTFADDHAGQVTGQGIQNFFVATPGLTPLTTSSAGTAPAAPSGGGLGY